MSEYPQLINDPRLTPFLERVRAGSRQEFKQPGKRTFDPDFTLDPPERHVYADLIGECWYWVNGCAECNGKPRSWMTYIECEAHNRCRVCETPRSKITGSAWGHPDGWWCEGCYKAAHEKEKSEALAAMGDYDPWDFKYRDGLICPYCAFKFEDDYEMVSETETEGECPRCDHKFNYVCEPQIKWSMSRLEEPES